MRSSSSTKNINRQNPSRNKSVPKKVIIALPQKEKYPQSENFL